VGRSITRQEEIWRCRRKNMKEKMKRKKGKEKGKRKGRNTRGHTEEKSVINGGHREDKGGNEGRKKG